MARPVIAFTGHRVSLYRRRAVVVLVWPGPVPPQHPETDRAAAEPVRAIAVAAVEDLPRCHDFLSFVSGLVSPG